MRFQGLFIWIKDPVFKMLYEVGIRKKMNRFEQRLQKRLQKKEIAEGYREMDAELELMHAIGSIRKQQHMSQETLAAIMGKKREAISRLFSANDSNPTLDTLIELLSALKLTADITLRQTREGEGPIKVAMELTTPPR
jgi:DNA-binding phage protein